MVQITEKVFRKSLNQYKEVFWFIKLQVLPMSFTKSPADFIVLSRENKYLVECKEVDCRRVVRAFEFKRLSQAGLMIRFEELHLNNKAYLLLMFRKRLLKNSKVFMIPIDKYVEFTKTIGKKSGNMQDFCDNFEEYRISTKKSMFKLLRFFP